MAKNLMSGKGSKTTPAKDDRSETKSRGTRTTAQVLAEQDKDAQRAMVTAPSPAVVAAEENDNSHARAQQDRLDAENERTQASLIFATECGQELNQPEFTRFSVEAIRIKKESDYISIRCLKFLRKYLSKEHLSRLPWPKSKMEETGSNELFDTLKDVKKSNWKGETVSTSTSVYREIVLAMNEGRRLQRHLDCLDMASASSVNTPKEYLNEDGSPWGKDRIDSETEDARADLRVLVTSMEKAGQIHIQENRIKNMAGIRFRWRMDADGEIGKRKKPICIWPFKPELEDKGAADFKDYSLQQFLNFRISSEVQRVGTLAALIKSSARAAGANETNNQTGTSPTRRFNQVSLGEMFNAMNESIAWYQGAGYTEQQDHHAQALVMLGKDDDAAWSVARMYDILKGYMDNPELKIRERATDKTKAMAEKKVS